MDGLIGRLNKRAMLEVREELQKTVFHPQGKLGPSGMQLGISVNRSIGVATFPTAGGNREEMFKAADESLYVSTRSGRNRSTAWSPSMNKALPAA